jgi:hypothetical protein
MADGRRYRVPVHDIGVVCLAVIIGDVRIQKERSSEVDVVIILLGKLEGPSIF